MAECSAALLSDELNPRSLFFTLFSAPFLTSWMLTGLTKLFFRSKSVSIYPALESLLDNSAISSAYKGIGTLLLLCYSGFWKAEKSEVWFTTLAMIGISMNTVLVPLE